MCPEMNTGPSPKFKNIKLNKTIHVFLQMNDMKLNKLIYWTGRFTNKLRDQLNQ